MAAPAVNFTIRLCNASFRTPADSCVWTTLACQQTISCAPTFPETLSLKLLQACSTSSLQRNPRPFVLRHSHKVTWCIPVLQLHIQQDEQFPSIQKQGRYSQSSDFPQLRVMQNYSEKLGVCHRTYKSIQDIQKCSFQRRGIFTISIYLNAISMEGYYLDFTE